MNVRTSDVLSPSSVLSFQQLRVCDSVSLVYLFFVEGRSFLLNAKGLDGFNVSAVTMSSRVVSNIGMLCNLVIAAVSTDGVLLIMCDLLR